MNSYVGKVVHVYLPEDSSISSYNVVIASSSLKIRMLLEKDIHLQNVKHLKLQLTGSTHFLIIKPQTAKLQHKINYKPSRYNIQ